MHQGRTCVAGATRERSAGGVSSRKRCGFAPEKSTKISSSLLGKQSTFSALSTALTADRWHSRAKRSMKGVPRSPIPVREGAPTVRETRPSARAQVGRCAARWEAWLGPEARLPVLVACSAGRAGRQFSANYNPLWQPEAVLAVMGS